MFQEWLAWSTLEKRTSLSRQGWVSSIRPDGVELARTWEGASAFLSARANEGVLCG